MLRFDRAHDFLRNVEVSIIAYGRTTPIVDEKSHPNIAFDYFNQHWVIFGSVSRVSLHDAVLSFAIQLRLTALVKTKAVSNYRIVDSVLFFSFSRERTFTRELYSVIGLTAHDR